MCLKEGLVDKIRNLKVMRNLLRVREKNELKSFKDGKPFRCIRRSDGREIIRKIN